MRVIPRRLYGWRHWWAVRFERRTSFTFTRFFRLPHQYAALSQIVVSQLKRRRHALSIIVLGCSTGPEPVSIASVLRNDHPGVDFQIRAFDLNEEVLEKARRGRYTSDEVNADPSIPDWFVQQTFDNDAGGYTVKPEILQHISWGTADVLAPDLADQTGTADIVFCQNLIVNLPYRQSPRAFQNAVSVCADDGALFLDGVPLRLRERLTRAAGLEPLDYRIADIHSDVLRLHGESWPWHYWGVEPLQDGESRTQRYATIYFKTVA